MADRTTCPSCRHRLSPLAIECPVCGIPVSRPPLKRPLLFQVQMGVSQEQAPQKQSILAPALGRVAPVDITRGTDGLPADAPPVSGADEDCTGEFGVEDTEADQTEPPSIFWRLALMEFQEAVVLWIINGLIIFVACWQLKQSPGLMFSDFWPWMLALQLLVSWAYFMLPILLTGSSIAMLRLGFGIADSQPEKRISFSIFMLLSVALLPLSFLCMALTPAHATLAELLTGQEIRERTPELMRHR